MKLYLEWDGKSVKVGQTRNRMVILVNVLVVQWQPEQLSGVIWIKSNVNLKVMMEVCQLVIEVCQVSVSCRIGKIRRNKGEKGVRLKKRG